MWLEPFTEKLQEDAEATGDGKIFHLGGKFSTVTVQVEGITTATVAFEGSINGEDYVAIEGVRINDGEELSQVTADAIVKLPVTGLIFFRARISAHTDGEVNVTAVAVAS